MTSLLLSMYRKQLLVFGDHMIFKMECHIYVPISIMKGLGGHVVTLEEHISDRVETVTKTFGIYYLNGKEMTTYKSIVKIKCTYYINV